MSTDPSDPCLDETDAVAYVHRELDGAGRARVEAHIDGCAECRWLVSQLARASSRSRGDDGPGSEDDELVGGAPYVDRYRVEGRLGSGAMGVVHAAYDPKLDRKVALKLVRATVDGAVDAPVRLLREARAMARLSHPGVVPIYDVGTHRDAVFLAMEYIEGVDARVWLSETRPGWRRALAVLMPAGRGLAAAHAAGIVHRDVKPANLVIGKDGRARVTDFGLARTVAGHARDDDDRLADADVFAAETPTGSTVGSKILSGTSAVAEALTRTGAILGTPAYMAPEQLAGVVADAPSDQFSFCVLLYEALYGQRPFAAAGESARGEDGRTARVRPPPSGRRVPVRLRRILLRGLAADPLARWPSLAAMLDAVDATARRRTWAWAAAGAAAAVGALALALALAAPAATAPDVCGGGAAALAEVWAPAARHAALERLAGLGRFGRAQAGRLGAELDAHARSWTGGHRDACVAHRSGLQSAQLLDRRMACLERGRAALATVAHIIDSAEERTVSEAVLAVRSLPDPGACSDIAALLGDVPPPPPEKADGARVLAAAIEDAQVQIAAGRFDRGRAAAAVAVARARSLGHPPLLARALLAEGRAALGMDGRIGAVPALAEATTVALEVDDDSLAVEAWARRAWAEGTGGGDPDGALAGLDFVEAVAARRRVAPFARSLLHNNVGSVLLAAGHRDEARARFERALVEARNVRGPEAVELVHVRSNLALVTDDPRRRDALFAGAERELADLLGAGHPDVLRLRGTRGRWMPELARALDLLTPACEAYEEFHRLRAVQTMECWAEVGYLAEELGHRDRALAALRRAVRIAPDDAPGSVEAAGYLALWGGDAVRAGDRFSAALQALSGRPEKSWMDTYAHGRMALGLGRARLAAGDRRGARIHLRSAVADLTEAHNRQPLATIDRRLARARADLAWALHETGAATAEMRRAAGPAVEWLRAAGGRPEEIARLERLTGIR